MGRKMIDLGGSEYAFTRDGSVVRVMYWVHDRIVVEPLVLNWFGNTLWMEQAYSVDGETGLQDGVPSGGDIVCRAIPKGGWLKRKFLSQDFRYFTIPTKPN